MKSLTKYFRIALFSGLLLLGACSKNVEPTSVEIRHPDRHYYPILQGQQLDVSFWLTNTGENPLIITDIQPSCGCILPSNKSRRIIVPKGGTEFIRLTYNSTKNVGYAEHVIRIYGNILPHGRAEMTFDVNVVPDADYTRDYEELYREYNLKTGAVKEMVDGKESERGYYIGEP